MNQTQRRSKWILIPVITVIIAAIAGIFFAIDRFPDIDTLLPQNNAETSISIAAPQTLSRWPLDAYLPIEVILLSAQAPTEVQLWVDGVLVQTQKSPTWKAGQPAALLWHWKMESVGKHSLLARVIDSQNNAQSSNIIRIISTDPVGSITPHVVVAGDTLESLAIQYDVPVEAIAYQNGLTDSSPPPPAGSVIDIPNSADTTPPTPSQTEEEAASPGFIMPVGLNSINHFGLWITQLLPFEVAVPEAPVITASAQSCEVHLSIVDLADNENGFFIYQAGDDALNLERVATLGPTDTALEWTTPIENETNLFAVSAFNAAGESHSNLVQLLADPACLPNLSSELQWVGNYLLLPQPVDQAYFYYTSDSIQWERYPAMDQQFLTPIDNALHISPEMQFEMLGSNSEIRFEVWGWEGSQIHLLGQTQTSGEDFTALQVCTLGTNCPPDPLSSYWAGEDTVGIGEDHIPYRLFKWQTALTSATGALWQVSQQPFDEAFTFTPAGLLDAGTIDVPLPEGSFEIDFDQLAQQVLTSKQEPSPPIQAAPQQANPGYSLEWIAPLNANAVISNWTMLPITFYVRITPFVGGQPGGSPSNTVVVQYTHKAPPPPQEGFSLEDIYDIRVVEFRDEIPMDINRWGCVTVLEDYYQLEPKPGSGWIDSMESGMNPGPPLYNIDDPDCKDPQKSTCQYSDGGAGYQKYRWYFAGQELCPSDYDAPSDIENIAGAMSDFVTGTWDWLVGGIQWLKTQIVDAFVSILDEIGIDCNDTCRQYAELGLDIAITYFTGIPPNLPNSEEMLDISLDYAVEMAVAELGVDCDEWCQQVIRDTLETAYDMAVSSQGSNACISEDYAHAYGKEQLCLDPLMKTRPVERSSYSPANAIIEIKRSVNAPPVREGEEEFYAFRLMVDGFNDAVVGLPFYVTPDYTFDVVQPLQGALYETIDRQIPPIGANQTIQVPLLLAQSAYIVPNHVESLEAANASDRNEAAIAIYDRYCLKQGGTMTVSLQMMCAGDFMGEWEMCYDAQTFEVPVAGGLCGNFTGFPALEPRQYNNPFESEGELYEVPLP